MKSADFWKTLLLSEKLHVAGLVVQKSEQLSATASDETVRETKIELEELAVRMLEDCIKDLRDPGRYR